MIVEYVRYTIPAERAAAFEAAYAQAASALDRSAHCRAYDLARCVGEPTAFTLRIAWDSLEGHLQGFRAGPEFPTFYAAVAPFVDAVAEMRHYQPTPITSAKGGGADDDRPTP
jgi:quinol monooxygenase YgiN